MRVALLQLRVTDTPFPPFGIMYLGAILEHAGFSVKLLHPGPTEDETATEQVKRFSPDLVGFTLLTVQYARLRELLPRLRLVLPRARFCAGGVHPTALPERTLRELPLDFVVLGEGEEALLQVCERLDRGQWIDNLPGVAFLDGDAHRARAPRPLGRRLDELPQPARHLLDMERYLRPPGLIKGYPTNRSTSILASRGCPHHCIFCGSHLIFGRRTRRRPVGSVLDEIRHLIEIYRIESLFFSDDTVGEDTRWLAELCRGMRTSGFKLEWSCQIRGKPVPEDLLTLMRRAGCVQVEFGVETGSDRLLRFLRKGVTRAEMAESFRRARRAGLRTLASFMVGLPGETEKDLLQTLDHLKEIRPDFSNFFLAVPYPGTELYRLALSRGRLADGDFGEDWFMRQATEPIMLDGEARDRAVRWRSSLQNRVMLKNYLGYARRPGLVASVASSVAARPGVALSAIRQALGSARLDEVLEAVYATYVNQRA
jgi:anaerobic magnesium-protoporphyrin IX monomethyl ester cyclase